MVDTTRTSPSGKQVSIPDATPQGYPFQGVRYVDFRDDSANNPPIPPAVQDGSPAFPFSTFAAAVASVASTQTARPFLFVVAPGSNLQFADTLDLTGFIDVTVRGMNAPRTNGVDAIDIIATGLAFLILEDLNVSSCSAAGVEVMVRGSGQYSNITCQDLQFDGPAPLKLYPTSLNLRITDCTVEFNMVGQNAEIAGTTNVRTVSFDGCRTAGALTLTGTGGFDSFFTNMSTTAGGSITVDASHDVFIDGWTADATISMGAAAFAPATVVVL